MPEGYTLVDEYGNGRRFHVIVLVNGYQYHALQNSAGKMKLFRSEEKAIDYSQKHKDQGLRYDQIVTR